MGKLDGRVAVITSGSTGIGRGIGAAFLAEGAKIVINGRDPEKGARALSELDAGDRGHFIRGDVTIREDVDRVVSGAAEKFGRIDILVNNAGQGLCAPVESIDLSDCRAVMELNVFAVLSAMQAVIPIMRQQGAA